MTGSESFHGSIIAFLVTCLADIIFVRCRLVREGQASELGNSVRTPYLSGDLARAVSPLGPILYHPSNWGCWDVLDCGGKSELFAPRASGRRGMCPSQLPNWRGNIIKQRRLIVSDLLSLQYSHPPEVALLRSVCDLAQSASVQDTFAPSPLSGCGGRQTRQWFRD